MDFFLPRRDRLKKLDMVEVLERLVLELELGLDEPFCMESWRRARDEGVAEGEGAPLRRVFFFLCFGVSDEVDLDLPLLLDEMLTPLPKLVILAWWSGWDKLRPYSEEKSSPPGLPPLLVR